MKVNTRDCSIFWAGLGVGAVLAMVFAPKSGAELRGEVAAKMKDGKQRLAEGMDSVRASVSGEVASIEGAIKKGTTAFREARQELANG